MARHRGPLAGRFALSSRRSSPRQTPRSPSHRRLGALGPDQGVAVTLPASVEQYYWGKLASRPYTIAEYEYTGSDPEVTNGAYRGVSWFWRSIDVPDSWTEKQVTLHVRGFRQRIEIFVNRKLVGYDLIAETSYDCDISAALKPGANALAIRITNPGGVYDWRDYVKLRWGAHEFQAGRGFGGLDRALSLHIHDHVFLDDLWVLNTPQATQADAWTEIRNTRAAESHAGVRFTVHALDSDDVLASAETETHIPAQSNATVHAPLSYPNAKLWSPDSPALYRVRAELTSSTPANPARDRKERVFGFRWFEPTGIGGDAMLTLNGERIRLYSAIEFGYWGLNGLWPTPALARKSVAAAKSLGLNALQYHRNIGKHEELMQDDRQGLLRYMEPGGGVFTFQDDGEKFFLDRFPPHQAPHRHLGQRRGPRKLQPALSDLSRAPHDPRPSQPPVAGHLQPAKRAQPRPAQSQDLRHSPRHAPGRPQPDHCAALGH